jgi:tight adherence protein C
MTTIPSFAPIIVLFASVAIAAGSAAWLVLERRSPTRRRLSNLRAEGPADFLIQLPILANESGAAWKRLATVVPKSPKEMGRLERRLTVAGYRGLGPAVLYALSELVLPVVFGGAMFLKFGSGPKPLMGVVFATAFGFFLPSMWLSRKTNKRQRQISNGLPDALDLLIVCIEAGSSIDQALNKVTDELTLAHPPLAEELRFVVTETRAGKSRIEAFRNLADRTKVEDVRSFVNMLVQTDRFGTSISQALRTHAETLRVKRRQRAEEAAAKLGIKLVFPLVFCLFPAFYIVMLGPAIIRFVRILFAQALAQ